jgi:hypothetical protein
MSRITTVNYQTATAEQQGLFDAIQAQLGVVPNFLKSICTFTCRPYVPF